MSLFRRRKVYVFFGVHKFAYYEQMFANACEKFTAHRELVVVGRERFMGKKVVGWGETT